MTKIYEGGGEYNIHLYSGRIIQLSDEELYEISEDKIDREYLNEQVSAIKDIDSISIDTHVTLKEIKEAVTMESSKDDLLKLISDLSDKQQEISSIVDIAKRQSF